jgi:hypothetical protein
MRAGSLAAGLAAVLFASLAWAQQAGPPTRIRGAIAAVAGDTLSVTSREGTPESVTLTDKTPVMSVKRIELSDIKPGSFIGTASKPGPNGELTAIEVLLFPENMRGVGEGHYAWDLAPGTMMTNANVDATVAAASGRELTLSYKGGTVKVTVPADAALVTPVPAERSDLKAGAKVFVVATKGEDGMLTARFVAVEKDGLAPPM